MKKNIILTVIGAGAVTAMAVVSKKIYELGAEAGELKGYINGATENVQMSADFVKNNIEIKNKYQELSDRYNELLDEYNELREEFENREFYGE